MYANYRRSLLCLILIISLLFGTACSINKTTNGDVLEMTDLIKSALGLTGTDMESFNEESLRTSEELLIRTTAYLEQTLSRKYPGMQFAMTACVPQGLMQQYTEFTLEPKGQPENSFTARVMESGDGLACTDGYYGVIMRSVFEQWLQSRLQETEPNARVISTIDFQFPETCNADTPLETALQLPDFYSFSWILVPEDTNDFEARSAEIRKIIDSSALNGSFTVYMVPESALDMSREETLVRIPAHTESNPVYSASDFFIR